MVVRPCREKNAIKMVGLVVEFSESFTEDSLAILEAIHEGDNDPLPSVQKHTEIAINVSPSGIQQSGKADGFGGVTFQKIAPNGEVELGYTVQDNALFVRCAKYTSWSNFLTESLQLIDKYAAIYRDNPIKALGLEYRDEFVISTDEDSNDWIKSLLSSGSPYISPIIFSQESYWHSHTGFFQVTGSGRLLNRINIDFLPSDSGQMVSIVSHHKLDLTENVLMLETLGSMFIEIKAIHKEMFSSLIVENVKIKIGLEGG